MNTAMPKMAHVNFSISFSPLFRAIGRQTISHTRETAGLANGEMNPVVKALRGHVTGGAVTAFLRGEWSRCYAPWAKTRRRIEARVGY
jgi:hypothetical protein